MSAQVVSEGDGCGGVGVKTCDRIGHVGLLGVVDERIDDRDGQGCPQVGTDVQLQWLSGAAGGVARSVDSFDGDGDGASV